MDQAVKLGLQVDVVPQVVQDRSEQPDRQVRLALPEHRDPLGQVALQVELETQAPQVRLVQAAPLEPQDPPELLELQVSLVQLAILEQPERVGCKET